MTISFTRTEHNGMFLPRRYLKLVRPNDDDDFKIPFAVVDGFTVIFITSNPELAEDTKRKVIVFKVV